MSNDLTYPFSEISNIDWQSIKERHLTRNYFEPAQPIDQSTARIYETSQYTTRSNVIPTALADCWSLLGRSELSEETFNFLVSDSSNRTVHSGDELRPLDARSLASFLHFWIAIRMQSAEPEIAISPKGNIQAQWIKDENDFLVLEFQPTGNILYSLWQRGYPNEGIKPADRTHELINMLDGMDENPLKWSDVI